MDSQKASFTKFDRADSFNERNGSSWYCSAQYRWEGFLFQIPKYGNGNGSPFPKSAMPLQLQVQRRKVCWANLIGKANVSNFLLGIDKKDLRFSFPCAPSLEYVYLHLR